MLIRFYFALGLSILLINEFKATKFMSLKQQQKWSLFKKQFKKNYPAQEKENQAIRNFIKNFNEIEAHNKEYKNGLKTFYRALNEFSDLSTEQFNMKYNTLKLDERNRPVSLQSDQYITGSILSTLPTSVDWRSQGYVNPIRNQARCGSCWSFSAVCSMEGQIFRSTGKLVSLSEQNLLDCDNTTIASSQTGCDGGNIENAFTYIRDYGIENTSYVYTSGVSGAAANCKYNANNNIMKILNISIIGVNYVIPANETTLQQYVATYGPISVAIDASLPSFNSYSGGIYSEPSCGKNINHAVNVVGYGSNGTGNDYWIVRNSWGTNWGLGGYMLMARNQNNMCGISSYASFPYLKQSDAPQPSSFPQCYLGCYNNSRYDALNGAYQVFRNSTIEICVSYCAQQKFAFAGILWGINCYCGNSYNKYGPADIGTCSNTSCTLNPNQMCGSKFTMVVYNVTCAFPINATNMSTTTRSTTMMSTTMRSTTTTKPSTTTTIRIVNPFANLDTNVVNVIKSYSPTASNAYIIDIASNTTNIASFFDMLTSRNYWKSNCPQANCAYQYLEDSLVLRNDTVIVTLNRLLALMKCRPNCNFQRLLSVPSSFNSNLRNFASSIIQEMNPNVQSRCSSTLGQYITLGTNASSVISNINSINLYTPSQLGNFSQNNSLQIAAALTSSGQTLSGSMAKSLGLNIPSTSSLNGIASIASGLPLQIFNNTSPSNLVSLLGSMDLSNMDSFRKGFIGNLIVASNSSTVISNMLINCTDSSIINTIPTRMFTSLNINISQIPASNLPQAFLKSYSRTVLSSTSLANITDSNILQKIITGITKSDLNSIPDSLKINTLVNLVSASITSGISLTYNQRTAMLNSLLDSLQILSKSTLPSVYLGLLNTTQLQSLYVLFIEANSTILSAFSTLPSFTTVVSQAATLTSSQCCNYLRSSRKLFTTYAISATITNSILQYSDLLSLGICFATTLPTSYLQTMNASDFVAYFANAGASFQPDSTQQTIVSNLISTAASTMNSLEIFVLSTLNDLAVFYNNIGALNNTYFKTYGAQVVSLIKANRDPTSSSVQLCQMGLNNTASIGTLISTFGSSFANAYLNAPSSRRRRAITSLTCTIVNDLSGSLNSLSTSLLSTLSNSDFTSCQTVLGLSSNSWSSAQLTQLASQAKAVYPVVSSITDTNIAALNSIMMGFSTSDLRSLTFSSVTSISALGALSGWSSAQLTALNTPLMNYISINGMSSTLLSSMNNLACALNSTYVNGISTSVFSSAVTTLSKISLSCPNAASWYALAKQVYGSSLYNSSSSLYELGSVISGISSSDFQSISSDVISSITTSAWAVMPTDTVNLLTTTQMNGLSNTAINELVNSPNYSSFSSIIQSNLNSLSTGSTAKTTSSSTRSDSSSTKFSLVFLTINTILSIILNFIN